MTRQKIQGLSSNNFYTLPPPLNVLQKGKYAPKTWLIQRQPLQIFYKLDAAKLCKIHKKISLLELLSNKVVGLQAWNLIKKRLQHKYFPVNFGLFFNKNSYRTPLDECSCWFLYSNEYVVYWSHFFHFFLCFSFHYW